MLQIIYDALKRLEYATLFRSSALFALGNIVRSKSVGQGSCDVNETLTLISRVCDIAEGHLLITTTSASADSPVLIDLELFLVCLQRLVNASVSILMEIDPSSPLMQRMYHLWEAVRNMPSSLHVERECVEFIVSASMFPSAVVNYNELALFLKKVGFVSISQFRIINFPTDTRRQ